MPPLKKNARPKLLFALAITSDRCSFFPTSLDDSPLTPLQSSDAAAALVTLSTKKWMGVCFCYFSYENIMMLG